MMRVPGLLRAILVTLWLTLGVLCMVALKITIDRWMGW